ncbi:MAG: hypothetical protein M4579_002864 [Chaenotheca gracillima]|nr:MAG: hypothetical protein M4579_002864 [Chaenotheca gracillima]
MSPLFRCLSLLLVPLAPMLVLGASSASAPTAKILNGTYRGEYLGGDWDQDVFLGMPYAQPPVDSLRFKWPQSLNESFSGVRDATQYGYSCYQYGSNFNLSEDCLTLNVIRPHGQHKQKLPVLLWIYGGGLTAGSSADPQYNMSGIVRSSQDAKQPFIGVSINYRLGVWGFLQNPQILAEGSANAGLLDQRMAMRWLRDNIAAFGGDPDRVTIWGESAGAQSIGYHLHSYGGRNDDLFHGAIMESGSTVGTQVESLAYYASPFENLTRTTNCYSAKDKLACLRGLSSDNLYKSQVSVVWNPIIDGDFLTAYPSDLQAKGQSIHVPLLIGANTDEGTSFGTSGLDNETAIFNNLLIYRSYAITPPSARRILELYPNDPAHEPPFHVTEPTIFPKKGLQWRRHCAIAGDIVIHCGKRKTAEEYTRENQPVYSYRFDTPLYDGAVTEGAQHFVNVVFSFQNISGALGPLPQFQSYADLSTAIGRAYTGFVNRHDPNSAGAKLPRWPRYSIKEPTNMVLNSNKSFVEPDTYRKEGIAFLNTISRELLA